MELRYVLKTGIHSQFLYLSTVLRCHKPITEPY